MEQLPINIKKYITPFRLVSLIAIILAVIVVWNLGIKKWEQRIYQRGVQDNAEASIKNFTQQYVQTGQIQVQILVNGSTVPDVNGTNTATGIFILRTK